MRKNRTIDFHAHVLPGCDHGSDGVTTSLRQMQLAKAAGVDLICATSHFYAEQEDVESFLARRSACSTALEEVMAADRDAFPKLRLGAEVLAFPGIERLPGLERLCLEGTRLLLLEMPFVTWNEAVCESVLELLENSVLHVVLAHAERYSPDDVNQLVDYGAEIQFNAGVLNHRFLKRSVRDWLHRGKVVALGSDIHGAGNAYDIWTQAGKKQAAFWDEIMCRTNEMMDMAL